jgi:uncharacterized protein (DUF488 family)
MKEIYTIGYSTFKLEEFVSILKKYNIKCLVDVRSNPKSKYFKDYDKQNLEKILKSNNIYYRNYKEEFGARQENLVYFKKGYLDFSQYVKSERFKRGMEKIEAGIALGYSFVLMCAEKDPATCHRSIMVGRDFSENGFTVKNILSDKSYETQEELERRLVNHYFPNRSQISLFSNTMSMAEMIEKSYALRNSEIGYRVDDDLEENIS